MGVLQEMSGFSDELLLFFLCPILFITENKSQLFLLSAINNL